jgi:predicted RNA-binding protein with PUA-like domain
MTLYLCKTEPDDYAYDDLVRDKKTAWTGVRNPAAQKHMRAITKGDEILVYHTGNEKRIAGLAKVVKGAYPDPDLPGTTAAGDPKGVLFDLAPVKAASKDCTLKDIKADARFAEFDLVRQSRLSVMPVPKDLEPALRALAGL